MLRFCANLGFLFPELPFLDRFAAASRAGFAGVEFASPYEHPAAELRTRLRDNGLTQVLFNSPGGNRAAGERGFACLPGREAAFRDSIMQALDSAAALDCRLVHVMAGVPPADLPQDTALALYAVNLAWAAERAAAAGVRLVIEPLNPRDAPGYLLRTQEQGAAIVAAIGRDRIGLQFDLYHCQTAQGDLTTRLAALMPVIDHMQLADVPGRHEPGTGEIGWGFVFRRIDELGYAGWIGCEYAPLGDTVEGLAWRRRYGVCGGAERLRRLQVPLTKSASGRHRR
jgi:hydroxypyruvate isomerase